MKSLHLKLNKKSTLLWSVILFLSIFLFMAVFPSMANESMQTLVDSKLEGLPPALLSIVGFETIPDFGDITVFYAYIMQYINIALAIFSLSLGLASFLQEEIDGTIEYLFAQPLSRRDLIIEKLKANIIIITITVSFIVFASLLSFCLFIPKGISIVDLLKDSLPVFISYYFLSLVFLLLGSGLSLLLKSGSKANVVAMAIVFASYFIGIMSSLVKALNSLEIISLLHVLLPSNLYTGDYDLLGIGLWLVIAIIVFVIGLKSFDKRDILV